MQQFADKENEYQQKDWQRQSMKISSDSKSDTIIQNTSNITISQHQKQYSSPFKPNFAKIPNSDSKSLIYSEDGQNTSNRKEEESEAVTESKKQSELPQILRIRYNIPSYKITHKAHSATYKHVIQINHHEHKFYNYLEKTFNNESELQEELDRYDELLSIYQNELQEQELKEIAILLKTIDYDELHIQYDGGICSVQDLMIKRQQLGIKWKKQELIYIFYRLTYAVLFFSNQNYFHSNIKPTNLILKDINNNDHPKQLPQIFQVALEKGNLSKRHGSNITINDQSRQNIDSENIKKSVDFQENKDANFSGNLRKRGGINQGQQIKISDLQPVIEEEDYKRNIKDANRRVSQLFENYNFSNPFEKTKKEKEEQQKLFEKTNFMKVYISDFTCFQQYKRNQPQLNRTPLYFHTYKRDLGRNHKFRSKDERFRAEMYTVLRTFQDICTSCVENIDSHIQQIQTVFQFEIYADKNSKDGKSIRQYQTQIKLQQMMTLIKTKIFKDYYKEHADFKLLIDFMTQKLIPEKYQGEEDIRQFLKNDDIFSKENIEFGIQDQDNMVFDITQERIKNYVPDVSNLKQDILKQEREAQIDPQDVYFELDQYIPGQLCTSVMNTQESQKLGLQDYHYSIEEKILPILEQQLKQEIEQWQIDQENISLNSSQLSLDSETQNDKIKKGNLEHMQDNIYDHEERITPLMIKNYVYSIQNIYYVFLTQDIQRKIEKNVDEVYMEIFLENNSYCVVKPYSQLTKQEKYQYLLQIVEKFNLKIQEKIIQQSIVKFQNNNILDLQEQKDLNILERSAEVNVQQQIDKLIQISPYIKKPKQIYFYYQNSIIQDYYTAQLYIKDLEFLCKLIQNNEQNQEKDIIANEILYDLFINTKLLKHSDKSCIQIIVEWFHFHFPEYKIKKKLLKILIKLVKLDEVYVQEKFIKDQIEQKIQQKKNYYLFEEFKHVQKQENRIYKVLSNYMTILNMVGFRFQEFDFKETNIKGAILQGSDLQSSNFTECNLTDVDLSQCNLNHCNLMDSNLENVNLGIYPYLEIHTDWIYKIAYSRCGNYIASCSDDGYLILSDNQTHQMISKLCPHKGEGITTLSFSKEGSLIATAGKDNKICIIDFKKEKVIKKLKGHTNWIQSLDFSNDDQILISGGLDEVINAWDIEKGIIFHTFTLVFKGPITQVQISPDNEYIACINADIGIKLWNFYTGELDRVIKVHEKPILAFDFSQYFQLIASAGEDNIIKITKLTNNMVMYQLYVNGHTERINTLKFSPTEPYKIASGSSDRTVIIWDVKEQRAFKKFNSHAQKVTTVDYSPDGQQLISASFDDTIYKYDVDYKQKFNEQSYHEGYISAIAFPQENFQEIATGGQDGTIRIWNIFSGIHYHKYKGHEQEVTHLDFSQNDKFLVSSSQDCKIIIWSLGISTPFAILNEHSQTVNSVKFSLKMDFIVSASSDKSIKIWDFASQKCVKTIQNHSAQVNYAIFSHNQKWVVSCSDDKTLQLYYKSYNYRLSILKGHTRAVLYMDFSPDDKYLVSGSTDNRFIVWEVISGQKYFTFTDSLCGEIFWIKFVVLSEQISQQEQMDIYNAQNTDYLKQNIEKHLKSSRSKLTDEKLQSQQIDSDDLLEDESSVYSQDMSIESLKNTKSYQESQVNSSQMNSRVIEQKQQLAICYMGNKGGIYMWEFDENWDLLQSIDISKKFKVHSAAISCNSKYIVEGGQNGMMRIWRTKKLKKKFINYKLQRFIQPSQNLSCQEINLINIQNTSQQNIQVLEQIKNLQYSKNEFHKQQKLNNNV